MSTHLVCWAWNSEEYHRIVYAIYTVRTQETEDFMLLAEEKEQEEEEEEKGKNVASRDDGGEKLANYIAVRNWSMKNEIMLGEVLKWNRSANKSTQILIPFIFVPCNKALCFSHYHLDHFVRLVTFSTMPFLFVTSFFIRSFFGCQLVTRFLAFVLFVSWTFLCTHCSLYYHWTNSFHLFARQVDFSILVQ